MGFLYIAGDVELLKGMYDYMPTFKQIMDSSHRDQRDKLCATYPGFYRFAMPLEDMARGIQDGIIDIPQKMKPQLVGRSGAYA